MALPGRDGFGGGSPATAIHFPISKRQFNYPSPNNVITIITAIITAIIILLFRISGIRPRGPDRIQYIIIIDCGRTDFQNFKQPGARARR